MDNKDGQFFNSGVASDQQLGLLIEFDYMGTDKNNGINGIDAKEAIVADFFSFGFTGHGVQSGERFANQIIRIEAEESGDNTSTFEGSLEYVMVNQLNIQDVGTFAGIAPIDSGPSFIVIEDLTDEDSPRVNYNDLGADGVTTAVSDQEEAPSHSGVVSLNQDSYKIADTVIITLEDLDLNVDSGLIDIFTVVPATHTGPTKDTVGSTDTQPLSFGELGRLLDVTYDDAQWETPAVNSCTSDGETAKAKSSLEDTISDTGLGATGFTLIETGTETGVFTGDFQIPSFWCPDADKSTAEKPTAYKTTTGLDIEVNYVDFRDASGEIVEVGDSAGVSANTGSVSLDRTVYPVPFGIAADSKLLNKVTPGGKSVFPIHASGIYKDIDNEGEGSSVKQEELPNGDLTIHVRVNDPDFDINPSGEDSINEKVAKTGFGPVKLSVIRGSDSVILGYAGSPAVVGLIDVGSKNETAANIRNFGPINEIAPDAGILVKSDDADTLNNYGVYLCRQKQLEAAEKQFLKAIAVPSYLLVAKSYENLSACFLQEDDFIKAERYLHKAIMHSPSSASTLFQMVTLQYALADYQQAKNFGQRLEKITRRFTPQFLALAYKVYWKLGQPSTAKNYGTMLVKMYPQSWEAQQYLLNELEFIAADNLAKRYKLTQVSEIPTKSKKRVVKLSPKKMLPTNIVDSSLQ